MSRWYVRPQWAASGVLAMAVSAPAFAQEPPACADISGGAPILYGAGGSAQTSLVGKVSVVLQNADDPIFAVYKDDAGACAGIDALTGLGATAISGSAKYWDSATGTQLTCTLPLGGQALDFASMGNGPLVCPLITDPALVDGIVDVTGPISSVNLIVPNASSQQAISAEGAYLVYGFGPDADIAPWNNADPSYYIHRNENSFVQIYVSIATGLPLTRFYGVDAGSNGNSVAYLTALANPEQGVAFVSGDVADANRATVRTLAYQHFGQNAGYWPDSSATAFDKINVRRGQYYLWGPAHLYGREGATPGSYQDPNVGTLLDYWQGASQPAGTTQTITDTAILNKNVPTCAMEATRDGDLGPIYRYAPPEPCGCLFDFSVTGATTCAVCDDDTPCGGTDVCRHGFCEEY
ncbi:MAG: hypothetical protein ABMB14_12750 [Myxococcota bacterium]